LGVTQYLTLPAIDATMRFVASLPAPSAITLTYVLPDEDLSGLDRENALANAQRAAAMGEPWLTRFRPADLSAHLRELGFADVFQLTTAEATARYFANRTDGLRCPAFGLVTATV
jgi:O-methyltransferase involved in polyketide biosynthesis